MNESVAPEFEIAPSIALDKLVQSRNQAIDLLDQAYDLIRQVNSIAQENDLGFPDLKIEPNSRYGINLTDKRVEDVAKVTKQEIDKTAWGQLMDKSGLKTFMDAKARADWQEQLQKYDFPELTPDNITATFREVHSRRGDMFEQGIVNVFRQLSWNYKSNLPTKFGKKIILTGMFDSFGLSHYGRGDKLDDMERVMAVLDGNPETDARDAPKAKLHKERSKTIHDYAYAARKRNEKFFETNYLSVKWFKNGNGHITFKRPDLVQGMNKIIAKHYPNALPSTR